MTNLARCLPAAVALLALAPLTLMAQHGAAPASPAPARLQAGAHAVPLLTDVRPILRGEGRREAYLTQPTLFAQATALDGRLRLGAALSLEPLTLEGGELGPGVSGEGYVDRRHPHTYLHEIMLSLEDGIGPATASLALGRGFAPFGTDDPMMRPFVKFPANHHLAQVLERLVVIGAVRRGPLVVEAGTFHGLEPLSPGGLGSLERFGDSWSGRVSLLPAGGVELQASRAWVVSPEMPRGEGPDQRKWSVSARFHGEVGERRALALAEWSRTTEVSEGGEGPRDGLSWGALLAEAQLEMGVWRPGLRVERTERPEGARTFDPFRTPWPHADTHRLGVTVWTTLSARLERDVSWQGLGVAPFGEVSFSRVSERGEGVFDPYEFYGGRSLWTLNVGARLSVGWHPPRMGRYGVALAETHAGPSPR